MILNGRFSGQKAIILKNSDGKFSNEGRHIFLLGIKRYPQKITRKTLKHKINKRLRVKTFVKRMNKNHVFPTRYILDLDKKSKEVIEEKTEEIFREKNGKDKDISKDSRIKKLFFALDNILMDKFFAGKNKWFFNRLRF